MIRIGRPAIAPYAPRFNRCGMPKLFSGDLSMTGVAEVARVLINILAALGQRQRVIDHGSQAHDVTIKATLAQAIGAG